MLAGAEADRDEYKAYQSRYYAAETRAAVLDEKLKGNRINEVLTNLCMTVGGACVGLVPTFYPVHTAAGLSCGIVGLVLLVSGFVGRAKYK